MVRKLLNILQTSWNHILNRSYDNYQTGFTKGRNIGSNIRTIIDLIEYCDVNQISGSIILLDIEKAFDSVDHNYLFQVLHHFKFGDCFISWVKSFYSNRKTYIKGTLDKFNIIPNFFPKKVGIFISLEVLAWVKTACRVLRSIDWLTFEDIWIFLAFSIFQSRLQ